MVQTFGENAMFKIFSIAPPPSAAPDAPTWLRDPLAHPAISAMDGRALGDLPFGLFRPAGDERTARLPADCRTGR
jgi:hypothetical protein